MLYDAFPVIALWFLASLGFTLAYTYLGHHDTHQNIAPFSPLQWLLWLVCWTIAGLYGVLSWRRGGQTLGMRPWRLRVVADDAGLGFWWAWFDRDRLTWHDRASRTRMRREAKR